jgi:hypothetical protein
LAEKTVGAEVDRIRMFLAMNRSSSLLHSLSARIATDVVLGSNLQPIPNQMAMVLWFVSVLTSVPPLTCGPRPRPVTKPVQPKRRGYFGFHGLRLNVCGFVRYAGHFFDSMFTVTRFLLVLSKVLNKTGRWFSVDIGVISPVGEVFV